MNLITQRQHDIYQIIATSGRADSTQTKYASVVGEFLATGSTLTDAAALATFSDSLSNSRRAHLKAAVKMYSRAMQLKMKAGVVPADVETVQAAIWRFEALEAAVKVKATKGEKTHTWLSRIEVRQLMDAAADKMRDQQALGLLLGAGLRRAAAVELRCSDIVQQPTNGRLRTVLAVRGKGAKDRTVPISDKLADMLATWRIRLADSGHVLRSVRKGGKIGSSLSAVGLFNIVRKHGTAIGKPELAPHDLRRTYAQIGLDSGVSITQISTLLGHEDVATTQRYLNLKIDLEATISDFVPL